MSRLRVPFAASLYAGPGFQTVARAASAFADCVEWPQVATWVPRLSSVGIAVPVTFVAQGPGVTVGGYDDEIVERRRVPSRERSWHDFLNMLVWATFPRAKTALHRRQREAVARARSLNPAAPRRDRGGDALAMLDEGGVLAVGSKRLVFGHALYEHLVAGERNVPAFVVPLQALPTVEHVDQALALLLADPTSFASPTDLGRAKLAELA